MNFKAGEMVEWDNASVGVMTGRLVERDLTASLSRWVIDTFDPRYGRQCRYRIAEHRLRRPVIHDSEKEVRIQISKKLLEQAYPKTSEIKKEDSKMRLWKVIRVVANENKTFTITEQSVAAIDEDSAKVKSGLMNMNSDKADYATFYVFGLCNVKTRD